MIYPGVVLHCVQGGHVHKFPEITVENLGERKVVRIFIVHDRMAYTAMQQCFIVDVVEYYVVKT